MRESAFILNMRHYPCHISISNVNKMLAAQEKGVRVKM